MGPSRNTLSSGGKFLVSTRAAHDVRRIGYCGVGGIHYSLIHLDQRKPQVCSKHSLSKRSGGLLKDPANLWKYYADRSPPAVRPRGP